jgi:hypothetical protein
MSPNPLFKPLFRFFNEITDRGDHFIKSSVNHEKIRDEYNFLSQVPESLQKYYPPVFDFAHSGETSSYKIVKVPVMDASHYLIDGIQNHEDKILEILSLAKNYLKHVPYIDAGQANFNKSVLFNVFEKNLLRVKEISNLNESNFLNEICQAYGFTDTQHYCWTLNQALHDCFLQTNSHKLYYSHGDLCFSNILLHGNQIYLIDPKGFDKDITESYRMIQYDLAKLSQSVFGSYDLINHELFEIENHKLKFNIDAGTTPSIRKAFQSILNEFQVDFREVRILEASLFLSLIPFHKESQKKVAGFLINSLQIFNTYKY